MCSVKPPEKPGVFSVHERLPPVEERVIVLTGAFRCLGYRDVEGVWRYHEGGRQIENVISWYPFLK